MSALPFWLLLAVSIILPLGIFLCLPLARRPGLAYGVHVADRLDHETLKAFDRYWQTRIIGIGIAAIALVFLFKLFVSISLAVLIASGFTIVSVCALYILMHRRMLEYQAPSTGWTATVDPQAGNLNRWISPVTMGLCFLSAVGMALWAIHLYPSLPNRIAIHFNALGEPDRWRSKSLGSLLMLPALSGFLGVYLGLFAHLLTQAKRWVHKDAKQAEKIKSVQFQNATIWYICIIAILNSLLFFVIHRDVLRTAQVGDGKLSVMFWVVLGLLLLTTTGGAIHLLARFGIRGFDRDLASSELPDELANDKYWKLGSIYNNPNDSALMVEKRFGLGFTLNFGHRAAAWLIIGFVGGLAIITISASLI